jgi:hypothetical protein
MKALEILKRQLAVYSDSTMRLLVTEHNEAIAELEALQTPNACETCKYFMSNHSFRLGHSDYLNGCRVLITPSNFYCNEYEPKGVK